MDIFSMSLQVLFWGFMWELFRVNYAIIHEYGKPS